MKGEKGERIFSNGCKLLAPSQGAEKKKAEYIGGGSLRRTFCGDPLKSEMNGWPAVGRSVYENPKKRGKVGAFAHLKTQKDPPQGEKKKGQRPHRHAWRPTNQEFKKREKTKITPLFKGKHKRKERGLQKGNKVRGFVTEMKNGHSPIEKMGRERNEICFALGTSC